MDGFLRSYMTRVFFFATEALKAMEKVASHINEMQKIYEDYGAVFDQLVAEQSGSEKEVLRRRQHLVVLVLHVTSSPNACKKSNVTGERGLGADLIAALNSPSLSLSVNFFGEILTTVTTCRHWGLLP